MMQCLLIVPSSGLKNLTFMWKCPSPKSRRPHDQPDNGKKKYIKINRVNLMIYRWTSVSLIINLFVVDEKRGRRKGNLDPAKVSLVLGCSQKAPTLAT